MALSGRPEALDRARQAVQAPAEPLDGGRAAACLWLTGAWLCLPEGGIRPYQLTEEFDAIATPPAARVPCRSALPPRAGRQPVPRWRDGA
ncbi:hypothetical protein GZL_09138 [Streptomyces sp. 769]|nr:hypothetical protein GZL_09138 [Streptomyces sp. 769]